MKVGVRGKLFLASCGLIAVALITGGLYLSNNLRAQLEQQIEHDLIRLARTGERWLNAQPGPYDLEQLDPLADNLGGAAAVRVTLIRADGLVLGDSELAPGQIRALDNHAGRPEVEAALADGLGVARRFSTTLDADLLYVALPYEHGPDRGVIRVARGLDEVDRALDRLRLFLLIAGGLALGAALLLSALASHLYTRALRLLVTEARALAEGPGGERLRISSGDEIGQLTGSINRMSEALHGVVGSLAAERDRFEAVLEGMADGVLALDAERRITHINRSAQDLLNSERPPHGMTLLEVLRAAPLHEMLDETQAGAVGEAEFDLPGAPRRRILARAALRLSGDCVLVLQDVTDLRRLETIRRDFVANVSHELRTPVSIIRANAETLLSGAMADPVLGQEFLVALHRNAERLSQIIADLLDISRLESGGIPLTPRGLDLSVLAGQVIQDLIAHAEERQIELKTEIPPGLSPLADEQGLKQVLTNLVDNAIKYTPRAGHVRLVARAEGARVRIEIQDDGPGIAPSLRERIFERFFRVDKGRSREMGGTGLGLSIVKNLVERMGGQVGVEANRPQGSVFWCSLPRA